jgi:hypothetical protein
MKTLRRRNVDCGGLGVMFTLSRGLARYGRLPTLRDGGVNAAINADDNQRGRRQTSKAADDM